jgi:integrase/recombinase XerD
VNLIELYLQELKLKGKDEDTQKNIKVAYKKFINWNLNNGANIEENEIIKTATIEQAFSYRNYLLSEFKTSTVNLNISCLKAFFGFLNKHGIISRNIWAGFDKLTEKDKTQKDTPLIKEVKDLINSFDTKLPKQRNYEYTSTRDKAIVSILATTGIRIENILSVTMDKLIEVEGVYKIHYEAEETKGRVPVDLFLTGKTKEFVDKWLMIRKTKQKSNLLFTTVNGGKIYQSDINNSIKERCKQIGIEKNLVPHSFRYFCNNILLSERVEKNDIKIMLGWSLDKSEMLYNNYYVGSMQEKKFIGYSQMLNNKIWGEFSHFCK